MKIIKTNYSRRTFINNVGKMVALCCVPLPFEKIQQVVLEEKETKGFMPYLQNLTQESVTIMFISNQKSHTWIEYGVNKLDKRAETNLDGLLQANKLLHKIKLTGLKPGQSYRYRIVSRKINKFEPYNQQFGELTYSDIYEFKTPRRDAEKVSCVILNDIHDRPHSFKDLLSINPNFSYDFVVLNGDTFDYQTGQRQLQENLINPCSSIFAYEKPFLLLRGNHETRGKFARNIKDYFDYSTNQYYFSFRQGPVHFIILDSGEDKEDNHKEYNGLVAFDPYREKQSVWLKNELEKVVSSEAVFCVVLMHIPPYHSGDWHGTLHCRKLFSPLFEKYKVDMVVSGHTHQRGIHPPNNNHNYPIIIGGGPKTGNRTKIELSANLKKLEMNMFSDEGKLVGNYVVSK